MGCNLGHGPNSTGEGGIDDVRIEVSEGDASSQEGQFSGSCWICEGSGYGREGEVGEEEGVDVRQGITFIASMMDLLKTILFLSLMVLILVSILYHREMNKPKEAKRVEYKFINTNF